MLYNIIHVLRVKESLLAGLGKCHACERGGQSLSVHLASRALQVIVLPDLRIGGLKPQYTSTLGMSQTT